MPKQLGVKRGQLNINDTMTQEMQRRAIFAPGLGVPKASPPLPGAKPKMTRAESSYVAGAIDKEAATNLVRKVREKNLARKIDVSKFR